MRIEQRSGEEWDDRMHGRDGAEGQAADEAIAHLADLLGQLFVVSDDPMGPGEDPFAGRSQTLIPLAPLDDGHAELVFQVLDAFGERRLGDATRPPRGRKCRSRERAIRYRRR